MKVRYKFNEISTKVMHAHIARADEWFQTRLGSRSNLKFCEPMEGEIEFFRDEKSVHLRGEISAKLLLVCVKCLDEFGFDIKKEFSSILYNSPEFSTQMEEYELTAETINEEYLEDGVLDLENVVLEELLLAVPDYPRCNINCKGLCPECGRNLNHEQCNCSKKENIRQFDGLKNLLEG